LTFTDPSGLVAAIETGGFAQTIGTSGSISNVGLGLACLFNTLAASIEFEEDFVSGRDGGLSQCSGDVIDRHRDSIVGAASVAVLQKVARASRNSLNKLLIKLRDKRLKGVRILIESNPELITRLVSGAIPADISIEIGFEMINVATNPIWKLRINARELN